MLFKDYLEQINKYAKEHPEALKLNIVNSVGRGAGYDNINFSVMLGHLHKFGDNLIEQEDFEEYNTIKHKCKLDTICVNYGG
jgi:hypothetical protein